LSHIKLGDVIERVISDFFAMALRAEAPLGRTAEISSA
jgi:hypothetical protein